MTHEAQPALAPVRLAIEPRIGVGGRSMRLVRARLVAEIALTVASRRQTYLLSRRDWPIRAPGCPLVPPLTGTGRPLDDVIQSTAAP